ASEQTAAEQVAAELRSLVSADQVLTSGPVYDTAVALWNAAVRRTPAVLLRCTTTADVQAGVRTARRFGLPLSVRGQGHDWAGRALRDGGLTLDLAPMRSVRVDPVRRTATVGGATSINEVLTAADQHGLVAVTGTIGGVGLVGLLLGGGYGPLCGRFGLAADNLLGAELVLADGSVVRTDAEHEPDLFWALRGGGGNFGVVTSADVRVHAVPGVVTGTIAYPWEQARQVFTAVREIQAGCPDELTVQTAVMLGPDGAPMVLLLPTWCGDPAVGTDPNGPVQRLTRLGTPAVAQLAAVNHAAAVAERDAMFPAGRGVSIRTRSVPDLAPDVIEVLIAGGEALTSPMSAVSVHHFHGAASRVAPTETAFIRREPHQMAEIVAIWPTASDAAAASGGADPADGARHRAWAETMSRELAPYAFPGGYQNLVGPEATDQHPHLYGTNTARLKAIKAAVDPEDVFQATPMPID
ncbi:FAD-binding oxidoreductase, partial [Streptomyces sp. NPDC057654]|uniref:FAD-binding oxidoreductase n=1 Tax=Streptomyces sp. NPDC057654 TaxID=3346196 RepID=UPI0036AD1BCA